MRIKTGDTVKLIAGKDKGKTGTVIKTLPKLDKVVVEGLNIAKKHTKPSQTTVSACSAHKGAAAWRILACSPGRAPNASSTWARLARRPAHRARSSRPRKRSSNG